MASGDLLSFSRDRLDWNKRNLKWQEKKMKKRVNFKVSVLVVSLLIATFAGSAKATPITFTDKGMGSGSLAGKSFSDASFTISSMGDTTSRDSFAGGYFIDNITASIIIDGLGTLNFTTGTRIFVNNSASIVGFSRAGTNGADLFNGPIDSSFSTWDMLSSIGPIVGTGSLMQWWSDIVTDKGVLAFNNGNSAVSFQATVGSANPVPEPATMFLMFVGLVGFAGTKLRRRK
jgi:hypothetical protein